MSLYVPQIVYRSSDTAARNSGNTGNTLTNDDATGGTLKFTLGGNSTEKFFVEAFLIFNAANTTMDAKVAWSVPSGATGWHGPLNGASNQGGWNSVGAGTTSALVSTNLTASYSYGSFGGNFGVVEGLIIGAGGTAGAVTLQWAQNTSDAGDLVLKAGSFLRISRLA